MSNHGPVVEVGVGESDGPRPPGAGAGVTCHDAAMPRVMVAVAFVMAALIVASRFTGTVHTTWLYGHVAVQRPRRPKLEQSPFPPTVTSRSVMFPFLIMTDSGMVG
jgi:hypothetical protein